VGVYGTASPKGTTVGSGVSQVNVQSCGACRFAELLGAPLVLCLASRAEHGGLILSAMRPACRDFDARPPED